VKYSFGAQEGQTAPFQCCKVLPKMECACLAHEWKAPPNSPRKLRPHTQTHRFSAAGKAAAAAGKLCGQQPVVQPTSHPVSQPVGQSARLKQLPHLNYENVYKTGPFSPQQQSIRRLRAKEKLCVLWCRRVAAKR